MHLNLLFYPFSLVRHLGLLVWFSVSFSISSSDSLVEGGDSLVPSRNFLFSQCSHSELLSVYLALNFARFRDDPHGIRKAGWWTSSSLKLS